MEGRGWKKRQSVNLVSLLVTCLFLFLAVQFSDGGVTFATKIKKITENLDIAVLTLNDNVTYTDYEDKSTYNSSAEFRAAGMAGLYNLTNMFIDWISPKDILMSGVVSLNRNNQIEVQNPEIPELFKYYAALVSILLFLVLCVVLFPLCGLCFCCCRCCGNCGGKPQPSDKNKDTCKKVVHATLLIICGTGLLFCIVCAFGSNQQLHDGLETFPKNMHYSVKDTKTFMDTTNAEIHNLLQKNYHEFSDAFVNVIENGSVIAMEQLKEYVNATTVSKIYEFANQLPEVRETMTSLKTGTNRLRVYASQLNDAIRKVKKDLISTLNSCSSYIDGCHKLQDKVQKLQTSIDFNAVCFDIFNFGNDENKVGSLSICEKMVEKITKATMEHIGDAMATMCNKLSETASNIIQSNMELQKVIVEQKSAKDETPTSNLSQNERPVIPPQPQQIVGLESAANISLQKVPDVSSAIESFDQINIEKVQADAQQGNQSLYQVQKQINDSLTDTLSAARQQITNTATIINEKLASLSDTLEHVKTQIDDNASPAIDTTQDYINRYGKYQYYIGLTISCILLLVTVCIVFGLICGICGKRPDGYSDNCCNKGAGGQFLICAVMIMFLFGFLISIFTLVSFIAGVISEKALCDTLRNPNPSESNIMSIIDSLNLNLAVDVKPSTMLNNCYQNKSIYQTFNLASQFNLEEIKANFNIAEKLDNLNIDNVIPEGFNLLGDNNAFEELLQINPEIDVFKFKEELQTNFTNYSLDEITSGLTSIINQINGDDTNSQALRSQLQLSLLHITTYNEKLVIPMKDLALAIMDTADNLNEQLKMNHSSFPEAIRSLLIDLREAQDALVNNGPTQLSKTAEYFRNVILNIVNGYMDRISDQAENKIGHCGPLNLVIHASIASTCDKVLLPWNGFWFSLFCTIVLYIVTIIIAIKLANLYRKHKPGYDQYVETEYLYDAYADRGDNIPLNSRGGKRGKKKGKKSKRHDERSNVGREVAREYAAGSHPPDGRYADMAPKHWEEFPNGGPPHYQRAPTEYERPPPYYYPGSGG
ncbi:unnamed protein product [Ceutorhynchus assimilis]|uniref:Prominin-like protein n=1 Tax=Ceutorhynchus assimilis TaxID=467358 RepID=A0A9N9N3H5_9CUCU|nr:unnamed protein product [Ceutorhynchus assimilis]